ncbi:MAG TPA: glycosyltransferase [Gaiellaceae bacterium]|nr:glycosyltransferase [Gaiellaceae bacterium]
MSLDRDLTIVVKTFQRPDALRRLVGSIRRFYPDVPVSVVDDSEQPLDPVPEGVTRYEHLPFNSLGVSAGRNYGLAQVETPYVLFSDDDMVFTRRTDVEKLLRTVQSTRFDVVSCRWLDHEPWSGITRGYRRYEGTLEIDNGALVHRLGATRGTVDGLPVYDIVHQFFVASVETLGPDPWDPRFRVAGEHVDFFLRLGERGLLSTALPDVVVDHFPELPPGYESFRGDTADDVRRLKELRGFECQETVGRLFTPGDRIVHRLPSTIAATGRRAARIARRVVREGRVRAG